MPTLADEPEIEKHECFVVKRGLAVAPETAGSASEKRLEELPVDEGRNIEKAEPAAFVLRAARDRVKLSVP